MASTNADSFPEEIFCIKGQASDGELPRRAVLGKYSVRNAAWRCPIPEGRSGALRAPQRLLGPIIFPFS